MPSTFKKKQQQQHNKVMRSNFYYLGNKTEKEKDLVKSTGIPISHRKIKQKFW